MNTDTATVAPTFYCIAVKGPNGRKWFRADSASCGDQAFVQSLCDSVIAEHGGTGIQFKVMDRTKVEGDLAPRKYRPWDTGDDEVEQDVNLDELDESEL